MDLPLKKIKIGNTNKTTALATEIHDYFPSLSFPRIMKIIKEHGDIATREMFEETKKSTARSAIALFLWKIKNNQVIWHT